MLRLRSAQILQKVKEKIAPRSIFMWGKFQFGEAIFEDDINKNGISISARFKLSLSQCIKI
jgi:hypothetical protein